MLSQIWNTVFYAPLYNGLIFLTSIVPGGNIGVAVILLTLVVKTILAPLSYKSIVSQVKQQKLQPFIEDIKKKYPEQKEQAAKIFELYREHKANPFSGCLLIIVQIPVIIALYQVFLRGANGGEELLYSFVHMPENISYYFLGLSLGERSIILALVAGISQFIQIRMSPAMKRMGETKPPKDGDTKALMMYGMQKNMKLMMPVMIAVFAYMVPGAVALYWIATNIFTIGQELIISRSLQRDGSMEKYEK